MTRDITEDAARHGGTDDPEGRNGGWLGGDGRAWLDAGSEFLEVFGPVRGSEVDAELAPPVGGAPWEQLRPEDMRSLEAAYRKARVVMTRLRRLLASVGFAAEDFPGLCAAVDMDGEGVVFVGSISEAAAEQLCRILEEAGRRSEQEQ